jgi:hypothetical protein
MGFESLAVTKRRGPIDESSNAAGITHLKIRASNEPGR